MITAQATAQSIARHVYGLPDKTGFIFSLQVLTEVTFSLGWPLFF
ncbi:MAG: hypothetical protein RLZZ205_1068 [Bacteroidota bacterium]|jgi:hypothetical protein